MRANPTRRGVTLVEFLLFSGLSLMLVGAAWTLLRSGSITGATTHEGLKLQQGVRNLVENMVKDVSASVFIAEPHALTPLPATKVVLWVYRDLMDDTAQVVRPGNRLNDNDGPNGPGVAGGRNPWPFYHDDKPSNSRVPVTQVVYEWNPTTRIVTRVTQEGVANIGAPFIGRPFADRLTFDDQGAASPPRRMCENVEQFELYPFGYNELKLDPLTQTGELMPTASLPDFVMAIGNSTTPVLSGFGPGANGNGGTAGSGPRIARTTLLVLDLQTLFDYEDAGLQDQEIRIRTKLWSYTKLQEHVYFPYFTSVDDDLRF